MDEIEAIVRRTAIHPDGNGLSGQAVGASGDGVLNYGAIVISSVLRESSTSCKPKLPPIF